MEESPLGRVPSRESPLPGKSPLGKLTVHHQGKTKGRVHPAKTPQGTQEGGGRKHSPPCHRQGKPTHTLDPIPGHPPPFPRKTGQAPPRARACSRCSLVYRCQVLSFFFFLFLALSQLLYPAVLFFSFFLYDSQGWENPFIFFDRLLFLSLFAVVSLPRQAEDKPTEETRGPPRPPSQSVPSVSSLVWPHGGQWTTQ